MNDTLFQVVGQNFPYHSTGIGFMKREEYNYDLQELKDKIYQIYQYGLSINSSAIMGFALENLAELSKSEHNFRTGIILLEEAVELYSKIALEKVLRCTKKILDLNSNLNNKAIEKKYSELLNMLQNQYKLKQFICGKSI